MLLITVWSALMAWRLRYNNGPLQESDLGFGQIRCLFVSHNVDSKVVLGLFPAIPTARRIAIPFRFDPRPLAEVRIPGGFELFRVKYYVIPFVRKWMDKYPSVRKDVFDDCRMRIATISPFCKTKCSSLTCHFQNNGLSLD